VLTELRAEVGDLAVKLSELVVGESLDDDERQQRTVERFIADLESEGDGSDDSAQSQESEPSTSGGR
jgi:F-type H+-transporting ATPase subunit b